MLLKEKDKQLEEKEKSKELLLELKDEQVQKLAQANTELLRIKGWSHVVRKGGCGRERWSFWALTPAGSFVPQVALPADSSSRTWSGGLVHRGG